MADASIDKLIAANEGISKSLAELTALSSVALSALVQLSNDFLRVVSAARDSATDPRSRALHVDLLASHQRVSATVQRAAEGIDNLLRMHRADDYLPKVRAVANAIRSSDPAVFATEERLALATAARDQVLTIPLVAAGWVAAANIPLHRMPVVHQMILATFLDVPTATTRAMSGVTDLLVAVLGDVCPGVGIAVAMADSLEPHVEKEARKAPERAAYLDRLFAAGDSFGRLEGGSQAFVDWVASCIANLTRLRDDFDAAETWILTVTGARQASS